MLRIEKPKFERGDRTAVSVYRQDMIFVEQALAALQRENPEIKVSTPDAMRVLLREGWRAMGEQP